MEGGGSERGEWRRVGVVFLDRGEDLVEGRTGVDLDGWSWEVIWDIDDDR